MKHSKKSPLNLTPGKNARLPRNSFDMSYHSYFTSPAGLLLPNYVQDVQPGDFLKLDVEHFSRTMPVNTAAFSRYKEITDFYFVPYRLLWKWFDQFVTGVNDIDSALSVSESGWTGATSDVPSSIPALPSSVIVSALSDSVNLDDFGFSLMLIY